MVVSAFFLTLDLRTLFRLMFLADLVVCLLLLGYREESGKRAIRHFVLARLMHGLACLLISFRGETPLWLSPYLSNTVLFFGLALEVSVVSRVKSQAPGSLWAPFLIAAAGAVVFVGFTRTAPGFVGLASATIGALFAFGSFALMRTAGSSRVCWTVAAIYCALSTTSLLRAYAGFFAASSLDDRTMAQMSALIAMYLYCVGGGVGFLLMVKEDADVQLRIDAVTDSLTGLLNHRAFFDAARARIEEPHRPMQPLSLLVIDVDHFKSVNDTFGHPVGDEALRSIARSLSVVLGLRALLGRVGGEEFAVLLDMDHGQAVAVAEQLRRAVMETSVEAAPGLTLTVSIGGAHAQAASTPPGWESLQPVVRRCDRALYVAKNNGRNRTVFA